MELFLHKRNKQYIEMSYWLGASPAVLQTNNVVLNGVSVNLLPVLLINTNASTTSLPLTNVQAYTSTDTLPIGTYLITCEVYVTAPTGGTGWIASDAIGWSVGAAQVGNDIVVVLADKGFEEL